MNVFTRPWIEAYYEAKRQDTEVAAAPALENRLSSMLERRVLTNPEDAETMERIRAQVDLGELSVKLALDHVTSLQVFGIAPQNPEQNSPEA